MRRPVQCKTTGTREAGYRSRRVEFPPNPFMSIFQQLEAWKTLALAYEVYIECAAEQDAQGMKAALEKINTTRAAMVRAGLIKE